MSGLGTRLWLYGAALATGGAFSILFTGETYDGPMGVSARSPWSRS